MISRTKQVSRDAIRRIIRLWQSDEISEWQVQQMAEDMMEFAAELPNYPPDAFESISIEVLTQLDALNHQWIAKEDIPVIIEFLETPIGRETEGWSRWKAYWNELDFDKRREALKDNEFYPT